MGRFKRYRGCFRGIIYGTRKHSLSRGNACFYTPENRLFWGIPERPCLFFWGDKQTP